MTFGKQSLLFGLIMLVYLVAGVLYAVFTPPWQAPDEPAHYNYVKYLAQYAAFPELVAGCYDQPYLTQLTSRRFPPKLSIDAVCYEFHQPPLYYGLAALVFHAGQGQLIALRLLSMLLGAGVVALAFFIGKTIFPQRLTVVFGAMALVAFVPMHLAMLGAVNNDALAELIFAAILLVLVQRLARSKPATLGSNLLVGVLLGLGLITKTTVYIAVPLVAIALWLHQTQTQISWLRLGQQALVIYGLALGVALPWYGRNISLYGGVDLLGLARHNQVVMGQLRTADFVAEVGGAAYIGTLITTTFHSFWGQFGWMAVPMDGRTYGLLAFLSLLASMGLVIFVVTGWPNSSLETRQLLRLMGLAGLLALAAYIAYNMSFVQFQGRYLFPGLIPIALFFALGLSQIFDPGWSKWLIGGFVVALGWEIITLLLGNGLDKWAMLILGAGLGVAMLCLVLPRYRAMLTTGLLVACYAGLGFLALVSPFWFIVPHL